MSDWPSLLLAIPAFAVIYGVLSAAGAGNRKRKTAGVPRRSAAAADAKGPVFQQMMHQIGESRLTQAILSQRGAKARFDRLLVAAGQPHGWRAEDVVVFKLGGAVAAALLMLAAAASDPLFWIVACIAGFYAPDLYLLSLGNSRRAALQRSLPGFVDLLALSLESGLDLLVASERIMEKMKPGPFREELAALVQEYRLGTARKPVLTRWAMRTGLSEAVSLTSLIIQSDEIGGDLPTVLRSYAEDMRTRRVLLAEELAGKIPVKILFPMVVFFFPIVFVIILGPIGMEFMKTWQ